MKRFRIKVAISLLLGFLSLVAIGASYLALTDIWHGESDLTLEWNVLRLAALVIVSFHISTLATLWPTLRWIPRREG